MGLVLQLVETRADGGTRSVALMKLGRPGNLRDIADLGLTLPEAKQLLACLQQAVVVVQARDHATLWPDCASCGERFRIKDWRSRRVATLFGEVVVRLLRFRCPGCGRGETGTNWPVHRRSTSELDQLQAPLSALMTDRPAAGVLAPLLLVAAGTSYGALRRHTLELGERVRNAATIEPDAVDAAAAPAIARSLDATFLRSCPEGEQHLEGRIGNAETSGDGQQLFRAVANAGTDIMAQIRRALDTIGRTSDTEPTAFTDGCSSVRFILAAAGVTDPPILDWFHLSLRLQHAKQAAGGLPADGPDRAQARGQSPRRSSAWLADLQPQSQGGPDHPRAHPRTLGLLRGRARSQAAAGAGRGGPLPVLPERPSGRRRRTALGRPAGRDVTERGHGQFPDQPAQGHVAAEALVPARGRPAAPSPLRRLQRHARHRLRGALPSRQRSASASSHRGMAPNLATVPAPDANRPDPYNKVYCGYKNCLITYIRKSIFR
jgi:hypothetical protein